MSRTACQIAGQHVDLYVVPDADTGEPIALVCGGCGSRWSVIPLDVPDPVEVTSPVRRTDTP